MRVLPQDLHQRQDLLPLEKGELATDHGPGCDGPGPLLDPLKHHRNYWGETEGTANVLGSSRND